MAPPFSSEEALYTDEGNLLHAPLHAIPRAPTSVIGLLLCNMQADNSLLPGRELNL